MLIFCRLVGVVDLYQKTGKFNQGLRISENLILQEQNGSQSSNSQNNKQSDVKNIVETSSHTESTPKLDLKEDKPQVLFIFRINSFVRGKVTEIVFLEQIKLYFCHFCFQSAMLTSSREFKKKERVPPKYYNQQSRRVPNQKIKNLSNPKKRRI